MGKIKRITVEAVTAEEAKDIKAFQIEAKVREHKIKDLIMKWIRKYLKRELS